MDAPEPVFSLNDGGPFFRTTSRLHLRRATGMVRVGWLIVVCWVPLVAAALVRFAIGAPVDRLVLDLSVHARFLVAVPLVFVSERVMERLCRAAIHQLYDGPLVDRGVLDDLVARGQRLRDLRWVEAVIALLCVLFGQAALWGLTGPSGLVGGVTSVAMSPARVWYTAISLPLAQFVMARWLWHWAIWCYVLARLSRHPIVTAATHPDRAAGLEFLGWPIQGFAVYVFGEASIFAGAWATQLMRGRTTVPALVPTMVAYLVLALVLACGPLLLFSKHIYRARWRALSEYSPFAFDYVRDFHAKWIERHPDEPLLGTPDLQSLSDLIHSYEAIPSTRVFVFGMGHVRNLVVAGLVPMVPLIATVVPLTDVLKRLGHVVLGVDL